MGNNIITTDETTKIARAFYAIAAGKTIPEISDTLMPNKLGNYTGGTISMNSKSPRWLGSAVIGERIDNIGGGTAQPSPARVKEACNAFMKEHFMTVNEHGKLAPSLYAIANHIDQQLQDIESSTTTNEVETQDELQEDAPPTTSTQAASALIIVSDDIKVQIEQIPKFKEFNGAVITAIFEELLMKNAGIEISDLQNETAYTVNGKERNAKQILSDKHAQKGKITEPSLMVNMIGTGHNGKPHFERFYQLISEDLFRGCGLKNIAKNNTNDWFDCLNDMASIVAKLSSDNPSMTLDQMKHAIKNDVKLALLTKHCKYEQEANQSNILTDAAPKPQGVKSTSANTASELFDF